jgi:type II secretory pathway pseudopilin PulG
MPTQKWNRKAAAGFSLVELMVAMLIFMIIGGAAVALVKKHVPIFTSQQNQTGLNISMRNAVAQLQIDVVNAGTGYYQGVNIPSWPIGITIVNSAPGTGCFNAATLSYGATCFDRLNIIAIRARLPQILRTLARTVFPPPLPASLCRPWAPLRFPSWLLIFTPATSSCW